MQGCLELPLYLQLFPHILVDAALLPCEKGRGEERRLHHFPLSRDLAVALKAELEVGFNHTSSEIWEIKSF